jgi:hypothetical protein
LCKKQHSHLIKSKPLLDQWLCWKIGNGCSIQVGRDQIMGLGNLSLVSAPLLNALKSRGLTFLYQARNQSPLAPWLSYWKDSRQLGLIGDLAHDWERFIHSLEGAGILLGPKEDELRWSGGDGSGFQKVKNLYKAVSEVLWGPANGEWVLKLWKWHIELKLKCFFWLLLKKKILTWDALVARGWEGPGFCVLCRCNQETAYHLFVTCPFTQQVWTHLEDTLKISSELGGRLGAAPLPYYS